MHVTAVNLSIAACDTGVVSHEYRPIGRNFPLMVCARLVAPPKVALVAAISAAVRKQRFVTVVPLPLMVVSI